MKEYYKDQFKKLMQEYPEGGIVFTAVDERNLMVTDGPFGATEVIPYERIKVRCALRTCHFLV